ncbi:MAG: hypothetical protein II655_11385 [Thermoguttaceae bacterium]|nr:hypothetical protein [Thermoguttaceae bacterium]
MSLRIVLCVIVFCALACGDARAQQQQDRGREANANRESSPLFVPSHDLDSPELHSSVDAARTNRPPEPTKVRADLYFREGFLDLSSPTPIPRQEAAQNGEGASAPSEKNAKEDKGEPIRPLDPNVETTPLALDVRANVEQPKEPIRHPKRDRLLFFAVSVALAGLVFFLYNEYRYRQQLRVDLVKNAKLCSPTAAPSDFDEVLAADLDMTDPRAPSYVDPLYDAKVVLYADPDKAGKTLSDPAFDDYRFEATGVSEHKGPGLADENFDYTPSGDASAFDDEPEEEFVASGAPVETSSETSSTRDYL